MSFKNLKITLVLIGIGFTVAHGLIFILSLIESVEFMSIIYHYLSNWIWLLYFVLAPLLVGLMYYIWRRNRPRTKALFRFYGVIITIQIVFTIVISIWNTTYWGYPFKRPTVFTEVTNSVTVLQCASITNLHENRVGRFYIKMDSIYKFDNILDDIDWYYGVMERPFMVFEERAPDYPDLDHLSKIYYDTTRNFSLKELEQIEYQIAQTGFVVKGRLHSGYDHHGILRGMVVKFITTNNRKYVHVGLRGSEVSNDHYPRYEFLFEVNRHDYKLIKKQRFYVDIAGIEGVEYSRIGPSFSFLITIVLIIGGGILKLVERW